MRSSWLSRVVFFFSFLTLVVVIAGCSSAHETSSSLPVSGYTAPRQATEAPTREPIRMPTSTPVSQQRVYPTGTVAPVYIEPPDLTNALEIVKWFRKVLENKQFDALSMVITQGVEFWAPPEEFVPKTSPSQAVRKIADALKANGHCIGYLEGMFGSGYALEIMVGGANWGNDCPDCTYASFWFLRDDNGKFFLGSVEYLNDYTFQDEKGTAAGRSNDGRGLHSCTDTRAEALSCGASLVSRLAVGKYAYVNLTPPLPNRVREGAGKAYGVVARIQPGQVVKVVDGPVCADGWVWWKVKAENGEVIGWTAEGDAHDYWLVPCPGAGKCSP